MGHKVEVSRMTEGPTTYTSGDWTVTEQGRENVSVIVHPKGVKFH
jgi:hypothetical protein